MKETANLHTGGGGSDSADRHLLEAAITDASTGQCLAACPHSWAIRGAHLSRRRPGRGLHDWLAVVFAGSGVGSVGFGERVAAVEVAAAARQYATMSGGSGKHPR